MQPAGKHAYSFSVGNGMQFQALAGLKMLMKGSASVTNMILYLNNSQINTMVGFDTRCQST